MRAVAVFLWIFCLVIAGCDGGVPNALESDTGGSIVPAQVASPAGSSASHVPAAPASGSSNAMSRDKDAEDDAGSDNRASSGSGGHDQPSGGAAGASGETPPLQLDASVPPSDDDSDSDDHSDDDAHEPDDD